MLLAVMFKRSPDRGYGVQNVEDGAPPILPKPTRVARKEIKGLKVKEVHDNDSEKNWKRNKTKTSTLEM